jgi:cytochrome P450
MTQEIPNVIVAGTDTTAMTRTRMLFIVLRHENIELKLAKELATLPPNPRFEQLENPVYLQNIIQEAIRLHPAVPGGLPRIVPAGGGRLAKYVFPAGIQVSTQVWTFHRNPTVFSDPYKHASCL